MSTDKIAKKLVTSLYDFNKRRLLKRKINSITSVQLKKGSLIKPPPEILSRHVNLWEVFGQRVNPAWLRIYGNISGIWDYRYVPESHYYTIIEPCINDKSYSKAYTDKNFYSVILNDFKRPESILSNIGGEFYNNKHQSIDYRTVEELLGTAERFIIKPATDSGGGKNVSLIRRQNQRFISETGEAFSHTGLMKKYDKNFIVQEVIDQDPFYEKFNDTSLNTIRVLTYRSCADNRINILHSLLRVGKKGRITDNQASGGYACGLTVEGSITGIAVDKYGNSYNEVNSVPLIKGTKLPGFDLIIQTASKIAVMFPYSRLLGLDLCLDKEGQCRVIEVNNINNEINFFQMTNGPLFREFTEEIISFCLNRRRSFMIDYEI